MLCFWGLTVMERQAYIRRVGRVAGRARKTSERLREDGRIGVTRPLLEAHRQRTRSYRHDRLNWQRDLERRPTRDVGGPARNSGRAPGDGREVRRRDCENSSRPPL